MIVLDEFSKLLRLTRYVLTFSDNPPPRTHKSTTRKKIDEEIAWKEIQGAFGTLSQEIDIMVENNVTIDNIDNNGSTIIGHETEGRPFFNQYDSKIIF